MVGTTDDTPIGEVMAYGRLSEALDAIEAMEATEGTEAPTNAIPYVHSVTPNVVAYQNGMHATTAAKAQGVTESPRLMNRNAPLAERVSGYLGASVTEADNLLAQGHDATT